MGDWHREENDYSKYNIIAPFRINFQIFMLTPAVMINLL